jgi:hypothetical protein
MILTAHLLELHEQRGRQHGHDRQLRQGEGKDLVTGLNYDAEITTLVNTSSGFIRLDDVKSTSCPMITSVAFPSS